MNMKKVVIGLLAALALSWAPAVYADNDTEFGIEDDLTVLGTGGTTVADPDVEIKGFSIFGSTGVADLQITPAAGNVIFNGKVQVSSGMYVIGNSTFATGAYFTGISSFNNAGNMHIAGGAFGQVLKKAAGGGMEWSSGAGLGGSDMGNPRFLQMPNAGQTALEDSKLYQNADNSITVMDASSMTVTGDLQVNGVARLNGAVTLGDTAADLLTMNAQATFVGGSTFTTGGAYFTGISSFSSPSNIYVGGTGVTGQVLKKAAGGGMEWLNDLGGVAGGGTVDYLPLWKPDGATLGDSRIRQAQVAGSTHVYVNADIHLSSAVYFGTPGGASISTFTENGGLLFYPAYTPTVNQDAATKGYVDGLIGSAGPWVRTGINVTLDYIADNVGVGVASPLAKLHVSSNNPSASDYLFIVSSGPLAGNNRFAIQADGTANLYGTLTAAGLVTAQNGLSVTAGNAAVTNNLTVNGNAQLGSAVGDVHAINRAVDADVALSVDSDGTPASGKYAAKFYSGGSLAAWIKKK